MPRTEQREDEANEDDLECSLDVPGFLPGVAQAEKEALELALQGIGLGKGTPGRLLLEAIQRDRKRLRQEARELEAQLGEQRARDATLANIIDSRGSKLDRHTRTTVGYDWLYSLASVLRAPPGSAAQAELLRGRPDTASSAPSSTQPLGVSGSHMRDSELPVYAGPADLSHADEPSSRAGRSPGSSAVTGGVPPFDEELFGRVATGHASDIVDAARRRLLAHRKAFDGHESGRPDAETVGGDASALRAKSSALPMPDPNHLFAVQALVRAYYRARRAAA